MKVLAFDDETPYSILGEATARADDWETIVVIAKDRYDQFHISYSLAWPHELAAMSKVLDLCVEDELRSIISADPENTDE